MKNLHCLLKKILNSDEEPIRLFPRILEFYTPIIKQKYDDAKKRELDLQSLAEICDRYSSTEKFLTDMSLDPPEASQVKSGSTDGEKEKLVLSTIHSAKGLEWHTVLIIQLLDGYLPSSYSLESSESVEEEWRLFYVACTRAKKNLFLLSPNLSFNKNLIRKRDISPTNRFIFRVIDS